MAEHWQLVQAGISRKNDTPEDFFSNAMDYFKWVDNNPVKTKRTLQSGKTQGEKVEVEFKRPYTIEALCLHCGVARQWLMDIKETWQKNNPWYLVVERILLIIYTQNLEGAMVDIYNPLIVSKVLGLDKQDTGEEDKPVKVEIIGGSQKLPNSEDEVLNKLDFGKVEILKNKVQENKEQSAGEQREQEEQ